MEDVFVPLFGILGVFVALPWIILHYVSKWKTATTLTTEDENLLDELHELARRLDERMVTIERIVQADNPNWRSVAYDPVENALEDRTERLTGQRSNRATSRRN
jgi:phage shock protein B